MVKQEKNQATNTELADTTKFAETTEAAKAAEQEAAKADDQADDSGIKDKSEYSVVIVKGNDHGLKEGSTLHVSGNVAKALLAKGNIKEFTEIVKKKTNS